MMNASEPAFETTATVDADADADMHVNEDSGGGMRSCCRNLCQVLLH
jgi:hypothetical protein